MIREKYTDLSVNFKKTWGNIEEKSKNKSK